MSASILEVLRSNFELAEFNEAAVGDELSEKVTGVSYCNL